MDFLQIIIYSLFSLDLTVLAGLIDDLFNFLYSISSALDLLSPLDDTTIALLHPLFAFGFACLDLFIKIHENRFFFPVFYCFKLPVDLIVGGSAYLMVVLVRNEVVGQNCKLPLLFRKAFCIWVRNVLCWIGNYHRVLRDRAFAKIPV